MKPSGGTPISTGACKADHLDRQTGRFRRLALGADLAGLGNAISVWGAILGMADDDGIPRRQPAGGASWADPIRA